MDHFGLQRDAAAPGDDLLRIELQITRGRARKMVRVMTHHAFLIGAAADCDLVLADPRFPEVHSYLLRKDGQLQLRYLGYGPEITVDGEPVTACQLLDKDRLRTGSFEFVVRVGRLRVDAAEPELISRPHMLSPRRDPARWVEHDRQHRRRRWRVPQVPAGIAAEHLVLEEDTSACCQRLDEALTAFDPKTSTPAWGGPALQLHQTGDEPPADSLGTETRP